MSFRRDSLSSLTARIDAGYTSRFRPLDRTPRHGLLKVMAAVDAGIYHQLLGDLDFLARQLFPDTAEGSYLRAHWSARVPPLYASTACGVVEITGLPGRSVPAGVLFASASGERYYGEAASVVGTDGSAAVRVRARNPGSAANLAPGEGVSIISAIPAGVDSKAKAGAAGVSGGGDAESDEEYLARVLASLRNPHRYGKSGDWAAWAMDSSPEVSAAWEFKNFGVFGALLVQVINGNQRDGVRPVGGLEAVRDYISGNAPPVPFEVRSPAVVGINPSVRLLPREDTMQNRDLAQSRIRSWLQIAAKPGARITAGSLRLAIVDGAEITDATVKVGGSEAGSFSATILQYPVLGETEWN